MTENRADVGDYMVLILMIAVITLDAAAAALKVSLWCLLVFVPLDLVAVLLLIATASVGRDGK